LNNKFSKLELCRLCGEDNVSTFFIDNHNGGKIFFRCTNCKLIFVQQEWLPDPTVEKDRYLSHNNDLDDPAYQAFLSKLWNPLEKLLEKGNTGLDYGAGPGPALMQMMSRAGYLVEMYDPFFANDKHVLDKTYDFIVCTETAEHFHNPSNEFNRFDQMLKHTGVLGVMTSFTDNISSFGDWYYRRDPTHVSFYSNHTMYWIASKMNWRIELIEDNIVIFYKT
tara:strand:+ start:3331 stop:3996 length:666 start_codon:yes stop_codon:yes gene_type:complete